MKCRASKLGQRTIGLVRILPLPTPILRALFNTHRLKLAAPEAEAGCALAGQWRERIARVRGQASAGYEAQRSTVAPSSRNRPTTIWSLPSHRAAVRSAARAFPYG